MPADQYWHKASEVKIGCTFEFPILAKMSAAMLCVPYGNAESEQTFCRLS